MHNPNDAGISEQVLSELPDALAEFGFLVAPNAFSHALAARLRADAEALREAGAFRAAAIGRAGHTEVNAQIRGDAIAWFSPSDPTAAQREWLTQLERVSVRLNESLFLGIHNAEAHYAIYPPSAGYAKHVDRFADADERVVSAVAYLNDEWTNDHGGALRIFAGEQVVDVQPHAGTCVFFRSELVPHQVLESHRDRWSIACWFRRRAVVR